MDKIVNDKVDNLLSQMEEEFKSAVEANKVLNEELDKKVKELIDEHDAKPEVKRYQMIKDISDYMALTISMPLEDEIKERIIERLVEEVKNGKVVS